MTQNVPTEVMNAQILDSLERGEDGIKKAQAAATDYTRIQIREDSFAAKILPLEKATDDMLHYGMNATNLEIIWELEPDSPGAKWVPLQTVPEGEYITGSRYSIPMARLFTPKFTVDIDELRTTKQDIRKILCDNAIKDALAEFDAKFISTVNSIVSDVDKTTPIQAGGTAAYKQALTGKVQMMDFAAGLNRDTFAEARNMLPKGNAEGKFRLRNYCCLMNETTAGQLLKLDRNAVGGDLSQEFFKNGLTIDTFMGLKMMFTIKDDLVPDNYVYFFAEPAFLGKGFYLHDWTSFMKKEAFFIETFSYWMGGLAIGNIAGCALARFNLGPATTNATDKPANGGQESGDEEQGA
jgi:hypothetical protein